MKQEDLDFIINRAQELDNKMPETMDLDRLINSAIVAQTSIMAAAPGLLAFTEGYLFMAELVVKYPEVARKVAKAIIDVGGDGEEFRLNTILVLLCQGKSMEEITRELLNG